MTNYLSIVPQYLLVHKKKTRLIIMSVALSVALITGIFSMVDVFLKFEKIQVIHEVGNCHILVKNPSDKQIQAIDSRIDVKNSGTWVSFENGSLNGRNCRIAALDEKFDKNMNITITAGQHPVAENEMMLEEWALESFKKPLKLGDTVKISFSDSTKKEFIISGVFNDISSTKANGIPGVLLSMNAAKKVNGEKISHHLVEFKSGVNILKAKNAIKNSLKFEEDRIGTNERLLAVMGQSRSSMVLGLYATGGILFCIVLIAGVMMIYNTFNISVMERVRQFGLLRCIGASESQIKKLVRIEGLHITLRAIPIGIFVGTVITFLCSAILKFYNSSLFGELPLFQISIGGISAGVVVGFLTVFIASFMPAKKAASVSPVNAVTGSSAIKIPKKVKKGWLTKIFHVEIAMGLNNAFIKKKTLFLMACSIAISITLFLGFQVFIDFMHTSMRTTKVYTPDISLVSEEGIDENIYKKIENLEGTKRVYGRMFTHVEATFNVTRLTDTYKKSMGGIATKDNGMFDPPEASWLISYDENQFKWAKEDLIAGELLEEKLNNENGVIAVIGNLRNKINTETANLQVGDKVYIKTPDGTKEMKVMGVLRSVPFSDSKLNLTTFITTEKMFVKLIGKTSFQAIDIQLQRRDQQQMVDEIKGMLNSSISFYDARQQNTETTQAFLTMAVFIYGFIIVIALISVLNIINTMNTSVASKTRYLGVMRAIGMSDRQLDKMVLVEAITYSLTGGIVGCILGIALQKVLIAKLLANFHILWKFPTVQIGLILMIILIVTAISIISPLKRIKAQNISEVIGEL